jgi:CRISPR-associated protein Cas2
MILEKVSASLRGELTRWLIEPHCGVFVGHVNAMVRQRLWEKCCKAAGDGGVVQMWSTNTEQHFAMRLYGDTQRSLIELEGLQLVQVPNLTESVQKKLETTQKRAAQQTN